MLIFFTNIIYLINKIAYWGIDFAVENAYNFIMNSTNEQQILTEPYFCKIISKGLPSCQEVLNETDKLVPVLQDAFDDAHSKTMDFIGKNENVPKTNKNFYPSMMRYLVHNFLGDKGIKSRLVNDKDDDIDNKTSIWESNVLASNGIAGIYNDYNYRVLKAARFRFVNGKLIKVTDLKDLVPIISSDNPDNLKYKFVCQSHLKGHQQYLIPPENYDIPKLKANIMFLWDFDEFIKLYLAIPNGINYKNVILHDIVPIKHPAETIKQNSITSQDVPEIITNILEQEVNG
ncbi:hypothetical protein ACFLXC_04290 [Chloroflexota bacterium]